jgi:hypothetical protein
MIYFNQEPKFSMFSSALRVSAASFVVAMTIGACEIGTTNSFFSDEALLEGNTFKAGYWIPDISMSVEPEEPDGKKGFYKTTPCVTLSADIHGEKDGIDIFYEFSNDGNPIKGGKKYEGKCVKIPDGDPTHFQAQAVNEDNDDWKSEVVSKDFKVKTGADEGDVVINELMWMGSFGDRDDEWIELRNMTDEDIDISGWRILGAGKGSGENAHIQIPNGYTIEANGYFLLTKNKWNKTEIDLSSDLEKDEGRTNVSGMNLADCGEKLVLEDKNKNVIDEVWKNDRHWPDGWHGIFLHMSMARDGKPDDGTSSSSWHTCINSKCNNKTYWRHEGLNFGTPGKANLSPDNSDDPEIMEQKIAKEEDKKDEKKKDEENQGSEKTKLEMNPTAENSDAGENVEPQATEE